MSSGTLQGIGTILAMIAILSVFAWAYSSKRKKRFDEAAQLPFADEDQQTAEPPSSTGKKEQ